MMVHYMSDVALWLKHPWAFSEMEAKAMKDQMLHLLDEKDAEIERLRRERNLLREMLASAERELAAATRKDES